MYGSGPCPWAAWRAMRGPYERLPSDFDSVSWSLDHRTLVRRCAADLRDQGFAIYAENGFEIRFHECGGAALPSPVDLVGRPDLIAVRDGLARVVDCKTGRPSDVHRVQVLLYQLLLPCVAGAPYVGQLAREVIEGRIVYKEHPAVELPPAARGITPAFSEAFCASLHALTSPVEATREPSEAACRFCDVKGCPDRYTAEGRAESCALMLI